MPKASYRIELDIFSGMPNPSFEISREDFAALCEEVTALENAEPALLFDGLGFRGIIVSGPISTFLCIQNKIIKLEILNSIKYFTSNPDIILKAINLFKKYDKAGNYTMLADEAIKQYL